ncbi:MAG: type II secretion system protein [Opitutus sp.]|nr:type II secretion system protein [Opitutus sp.]
MKSALCPMRTERNVSRPGWCGLVSSRSSGASRGGGSNGLGSNRSTFQRAFTLVEVLASLLLMAIIIPVAMDGMSVASRAGILGQRKAAAMRVAERVLNGLIVEGETQGSTSGNTSEGDINYPWAMKSETWAEDAMLHLTVTVTFSVQGNNYDVSVSTLIAPPSSTSTTGL